ncbi:hypothetical protein HUN01_06825 [Nostoc edaphicum CCNP1411]|uniref:Uncharacterized protein n=1 Tax=Nostoc edaphicum CCNP1411 TaxID=1472755 RepID=A0A7D7LB20_9NOSO|nr:hypothetical protein [Nostoc edaphicum]QMS87310.1 hypothetical protein HUN01_06825 [Nostoc edaphicum CCNP1411]
MIRLAKIDLAKKPNFNLEKKTQNQFRKPPKTKRPNSPNPLNYEIVDPQEGLVPLFNSPFYATPDTPADPTDCDRYPDSPWCGENPFDLSPVGLSVEIVLDECNIGVQFSGTLGFIKLPPLQIVWRNPDCKPEDPPLPEPAITPGNSSKMPANCDYGLVAISTPLQTSVQRYTNGARADLRNTCKITKVIYPLNNSDEIVGYDTPADFCVFYSATHSFVFNSAYDGMTFGIQSRAEQWRLKGGTIDGDVLDPTTEWRYEQETDAVIYISTATKQTNIKVLRKSNPIASHIIGSFSLMSFMSKTQYNNLTRQNIFNQRATAPNIWTETYIYQLFFFCPDATPPIDPPPPPKKECCKMGCCPDNSDLERLLRLILKKIGSDDLPASVPKLLTKKDAGIIQIQNLAQYVSYSVKQLDALSGKYPLEIKIKDADLTQEGDQEKKVSLPNIAEALAEIMGILLTLQSESNANLIATTNSMIEAGSAKQSAILAADYSRGNAEYLGYKGKQVEKDVPFTFKPGEPRLDQMLKSGQVKVKGWENDDKEDLNDALAPILELAAMWKAANFKNLGTGDTLNKLKEFLSGAIDLSKSVDGLVKDNPPVSPDPSKPIKNEWDSFIEEAEQGFIAQPGITNTTDPYSRPLAQRPKIREIGNDTSDVEDQGQ